MATLISTLLIIITTGFLPDIETGKTLTAYEVVEQMKENLTCTWSKETVDTFKSGDPADMVTGIACTFIPTVDVLKEAASRGCNLIITHEPTYYNHLDKKEMLENDPVYKAKQAIIDKHGLIIFRFHDHWHRTTPDGIYKGMIDKLKWRTFLVEGETNVFDLSGQTVGDLTDHLNGIFPEAIIRVIGDPDLVVTRAAFSAGAPGSSAHIRLLQREDIQLIVIGEAREWETVEYVRDAFQAGHAKSAIILGHAVSEEAGMGYCAEWLRSFIDKVPVHFIEAGDPFHQ